MATSYSSTIKVYSGVPLVKGGTEVLYLSQGAAEGVLGAFLKATYSNYYFVRENRQAVQIDAPFGDLDDVNYISFTNASHGGKIFFGFVDRVVYINDNCTQIEFTIDPFPTYLGDTSERKDVFIIRNTPKLDLPGRNLQSDYLPDTVKHFFTTLSNYSITCDSAQVFFTCASQIGGYITGLDNQNTGIQVSMVLPGTIDLIHQDGGSVIGMFMCPSAWLAGGLAYPAVRDLGDITLSPLAPLAGYQYEKTKSGVYAKIVLTTTQGQKSYEIEDFGSRSAPVFGVIGLMIPSPMVFIYPKNYKGVAFNVSEGLFMQAPALPATGNAVYTNQEAAKDAIGIATGAIGGAIAAGMGSGFMGGLAGGGPLGAVGGAVVGAIGGLARMSANAYTKKFEAPSIVSNGMPVTLPNGNLNATFTLVTPDQLSMQRIDAYFDYYGYSIGAMNTSLNEINTDDEAYLQTGSEMLYGSEADAALNHMLMNGVKIRKTLS